MRIVPVIGLLLIPARVWTQQSGLGSIAMRVADAVCGNQVVILGELPSHGEGRAFEIKARSRRTARSHSSTRMLLCVQWGTWRW